MIISRRCYRFHDRPSLQVFCHVKVAHTVAFVGDHRSSPTRRREHNRLVFPPPPRLPKRLQTLKSANRLTATLQRPNERRLQPRSLEEPKDPAERWKWINLCKPEMYAAFPCLHFAFPTRIVCLQQIERHES